MNDKYILELNTYEREALRNAVRLADQLTGNGAIDEPLYKLRGRLAALTPEPPEGENNG